MRLPLDLDGPAPSWPRPIDAALEAWARLPARGRALVRATVAAVLLAVVVGGVHDGRWGPTEVVLVATRDLAPGAVVGAVDVATAARPADLVPADALRTVTDLAHDTVATGHVPAGSVLTGRSVRAGGPAWSAPPGTAAVAVPGDLLPAAAVGSRLDLAAAGRDGRGEVLARDAVVVADDGAWRWVLVDRTEVPAVAAGITAGTLVAAVLPPSPGAGP